MKTITIDRTGASANGRRIKRSITMPSAKAKTIVARSATQYGTPRLNQAPGDIGREHRHFALREIDGLRRLKDHDQRKRDAGIDTADRKSGEQSDEATFPCLRSSVAEIRRDAPIRYCRIASAGPPSRRAPFREDRHDRPDRSARLAFCSTSSMLTPSPLVDRAQRCGRCPAPPAARDRRTARPATAAAGAASARARSRASAARRPIGCPPAGCRRSFRRGK